MYRVAVRDETPMLERRVDPTVTDLAESASASDRPGEHLARAWHEIYGREPSPTAAYREAVRAVEAAAQPVIEPANSAATLGTMIGALRTGKDGFKISLAPASADPIDSVLEMLRLLWKSQFDRHGTADESVPIEVSSEEAEAAVHLAGTLVHWFTTGIVRRR